MNSWHQIFLALMNNAVDIIIRCDLGLALFRVPDDTPPQICGEIGSIGDRAPRSRYSDCKGSEAVCSE
jgi:hypothetical protein